MNKRVDNEINYIPQNLPLNIETSRETRLKKRTNTSLFTHKPSSIVHTSLQDIRNLAATLYLTEIPGLGGIEQDRDILIDEYYEPIYISD